MYTTILKGMKMNKKLIINIIVIFICISSAFPQKTEKEKRDLNLANYFSVQAHKIITNHYNKIILDETYSDLINNLNLKLDKTQKEQLNTMIDSIGKFRNNDIEREHLQILFENSQANAINSALPNPQYLLSVALSGDYVKSLTACAMTTLSSISNYNTEKNTAIIENLKENWILDKDDRQNIVELQKNLVNYLIDIVNAGENIDGLDPLTESEIEKIVTYENLENLTQKKLFFENNKTTYENYGPYWGILAKTYYELEDYENCLKAINNYENVRSEVFVKDKDFANVLPCAIVAVQIVYKNDIKQIEKNEVKYLQLLEKNVLNDDWNKRFYISQMYISLFAKTNNTDYLEKAYKITKADLNTTAIEQEKWIANYLKPVDKNISKNLTKTEQKKRKEEIKREVKYKDTHFLPRHKGFYLIYDQYLWLCDMLKISQKEKDEMKKAYSFALSVYTERDYVADITFDQAIIDKIIQVESVISDEKLFDVYNIYKFRRQFDERQLSDYELVKEIIENIDKTNYYLPSLLNSSCHVGKLGSPTIDNIPACLIDDNTNFHIRVFHYDENGEIVPDFYNDYLRKQTVLIDSIKGEYTSYSKSPCYFLNLSYCTFVIDFHREKFVPDENIKYFLTLRLQNEDSDIWLTYKDPFNFKNKKNFIDVWKPEYEK